MCVHTVHNCVHSRVVCGYGKEVCTNMTYTFVYKHKVCTYRLLCHLQHFNVGLFIVVDLCLTTLILPALQPGVLWVRKGSV
jgi:hypothetical protein